MLAVLFCHFLLYCFEMRLTSQGTLPSNPGSTDASSHAQVFCFFFSFFSFKHLFYFSDVCLCWGICVRVKLLKEARREF